MRFWPNYNVKQNAWNGKSFKYSAGTVFSRQNRLFRDDTFTSFFVPTLRHHVASVMPPELKTSRIRIEYIPLLFAWKCSFCSLKDIWLLNFSCIFIICRYINVSHDLILSLYHRRNIWGKNIPSNFLLGLPTACQP